MPQEELNDFNFDDVGSFANLLMRSQLISCLGREGLCITLRIDPNELDFLALPSNEGFALRLINFLFQKKDRDTLCNLFHRIEDKLNKVDWKSDLETIRIKLKCAPSKNNPPSSGSESPVNLPHQPYISQPPSWTFKIGGAKNKLIAIGGVLLLGLSGGFFYLSRQGMKFNADYLKLENELKQKNWKEADNLTGQLITEVSNDITKIECQDLKDIDKAWSKYSGGRFGFNAQSILWKEKSFDLKKFLEHVGWVNGNHYVQPEYSMGSQALQGQLPWLVVWNLPGDGITVRSNYLKKLSDCFPQ